MRYNEDEIQFIEDRAEGDGGLEAYRFVGVGYQCYAPQEAFSTASQLALQKRKIAADIRKLVEDEAKTLRLLGDVVLTRWVLLTPEFDSKALVEYARKKSKKTREIVPRPAWCGEEFEIVISTDSHFELEKTRLTGAVLEGLQLHLGGEPEAAVFGQVADGAAEKLTEKLTVESQLASDPELMESVRGELLGHWARGQAKLDDLASQYPTIAESVNRRFETTFRSLTIRTAAMSSEGLVMLSTLANELTDELMQAVPVLGRNLSEELAWCQLAAWFIDCPLKFRAAS